MKNDQRNNKYNTFNGIKVLRYVDYWKPILDGNIPPPLCLSIDPAGICNFKCSHCNACEAINNKVMTIETMNDVILALTAWKTQAVCLGGGGESTLNPNITTLMRMLNDNNIKIGMVTNGSMLHKIFDVTHTCSWIGISMDAATDRTFSTIKCVTGMFDTVVKNVSQLCKLNTTEVGYKYLIHPNNYKEIYDAAKLAKNIGCDLIHIRPGGNPWFKDINYEFTHDMITESLEQIAKAREDFQDDNFKVFGITSKFDKNWASKKSFSKCYAMYTTGLISPDGTIGLCFDRRGDPKVTLGSIKDYSIWGGEKHRGICKSIDVTKCPRCTGTHINEIFENVIIEDRMSCYFY